MSIYYYPVEDASTALQEITSTDGSITVSQAGTTVDLAVASPGGLATDVVCLVRNNTGATLTKGTAVYINGAIGQNPTVTKAIATSDATSAQTLGVMTANLANNANGYVTIIGLVTDLDTSAFTDGQQLYLSSTTAGTLTSTKQYAPNHLVYVAVVEHAHPTQGKLFVKVQNGYEMDELHNVSAQNPTNGQTLVYNTTTSLWEATTVESLPSQTSQSGKYLTTNGTVASWATVDALPSQATHSGQYLTTDGTTASWSTITLPTQTYTRTSFTATSGQTKVQNLLKFTDNNVGIVFSVSTASGVDTVVVKSVSGANITCVASDKVADISVTMDEKSSAPAADRYGLTRYSNLYQIFSVTSTISDVQNAATVEVTVNGSPKPVVRDHLEKKILLEGKINAAFIGGQQSNATFKDQNPYLTDQNSGGGAVQTTRGVDNYIELYGVTLNTGGGVAPAIQVRYVPGQSPFGNGMIDEMYDGAISPVNPVGTVQQWLTTWTTKQGLECLGTQYFLRQQVN